MDVHPAVSHGSFGEHSALVVEIGRHDCLTLLAGGWMNHCPSGEVLSTQDGPTACHIEIRLSNIGSGEDTYWASKKDPFLPCGGGIRLFFSSLAASFLCYSYITPPGPFQSVSEVDRLV